jgi:hypothetical protein
LTKKYDIPLIVVFFRIFSTIKRSFDDLAFLPGGTSGEVSFEVILFLFLDLELGFDVETSFALV